MIGDNRPAQEVMPNSRFRHERCCRQLLQQPEAQQRTMPPP